MSAFWVSRISNTPKLFLSMWLASIIIHRRSDTFKTSIRASQSNTLPKTEMEPGACLPSFSSSRILPGVPTAMPSLLFSQISIDSFSLKCFAKSFATMAFLDWYFRIAVATCDERSAATEMMRVWGAPLTSDAWSRRNLVLPSTRQHFSM